MNFAAMIQFEKFVLKNGLRVIVHEDKNTPMAVVNVMVQEMRMRTRPALHICLST